MESGGETIKTMAKDNDNDNDNDNDEDFSFCFVVLQSNIKHITTTFFMIDSIGFSSINSPKQWQLSSLRKIAAYIRNKVNNVKIISIERLVNLR